MRIVADPMVRIEADGRKLIVAELKIQATVIATVCEGSGSIYRRVIPR